MTLHKINLETSQHQQMIDISSHVNAAVQYAVKHNNFLDGLVLVYCPHTTAAITINENADPDVRHDLLMRLEDLYPWHHSGDQHGEGNSAAHLKASTLGASQMIPVRKGQMLLGTWQGIYFCEFDGPRSRSFFIKLIQG